MSSQEPDPAPELDLDTLSEIAKAELIHLLEEFPGQKDVVIEEALLKPLDRLAGMRVLKAHGAEKIFKLEGSVGGLGWGEGVSRRVYFLRPTIANARLVGEQVAAERADAHKAFSVVFVPRRLAAVDAVLEAGGVWERVSLRELRPGFQPVEAGLLSLELPEFLPSFYLDEAWTWTQSAAHALWQLESLFGPIPRVEGVGAAAAATSAMLDSLNYELGEAKPQTEQPFSHLLLLDRCLDWVTPLLSCMTYEGLLDEAFGIRCGYLDLPAEVAKADKVAKLSLASSGGLYASIRDRHFAHLSSHLGTKAKELQATAEQRHASSEVAHLKDFVANQLRGLKEQQRQLQLHIGAAEAIIQRKASAKFQEIISQEQRILSGAELKEATAYIEDLICQQTEPDHGVRALLCLLSLSQNGLPSKDYESLKTLYVHAYGFHHLLTFHNLKRLGLFTERSGNSGPSLPSALANSPQVRELQSELKQQFSVSSASSSFKSPSSSSSQQSPLAGLPSFAALCRKLQLLPGPEASTSPQSLASPTDMSYVFNGAFTPALPRLVEKILREGFREEELSRTFHCPLVRKDSKAFPGNRPADGRQRRSVLVYFLGGVCRAELAALRLLERNLGIRIVVAATHVIRREEFLNLIATA